MSPSEAAALVGVRAEQIERDCRLRRKAIARIVDYDEQTERANVVGYRTLDLIHEYGVSNWRLKLAALELARFLNRGSRALRARIES